MEHNFLQARSLSIAEVKDGCVTFYEDNNYGGYDVKFCDELVTAAGVGLENAISSFKVGGGDYAYIVCRNSTGCSWAIRNDRTNFGNWNNQITKIRKIDLDADCVMFYDENYWTGSSYVACGDVADLGAVGFNDLATSLLLGSNVESVEVFKDTQYGGNSKTYSSHDSKLGGEGFNNNISSLKITLKA
eukprot:CAMPEP_0115008252 /NCGR_PEP_ID=MMETSP0216-20121206/21785_1 /TAXON_ID=223996 /ORGANISM="Protocruzia adherens, Strain Boccale" /LENGTH=187 /DNA_ID=CAMNT_0002375591 /DNA_START=118 /DNA_END=681 /DNA_ORIENTATION=-